MGRWIGSKPVAVFKKARAIYHTILFMKNMKNIPTIFNLKSCRFNSIKICFMQHACKLRLRHPSHMTAPKSCLGITSLYPRCHPCGYKTKIIILSESEAEQLIHVISLYGGHRLHFIWDTLCYINKYLLLCSALVSSRFFLFPNVALLHCHIHLPIK